MTDARVTGLATLPNGTYDVPERDLAGEVLLEAIDDAGCTLSDVDGLYMPKPRPWTDQGFFTTLLEHQFGLELAESVETYTGGTSGGHAFQHAVGDVRDGSVERAVVLAVERNSTIETDDYLEYILSIFDREFQSPAGPTIPGVYAMSLQRYRYEYDVDREDIASVVVKNRENAAANPDALFDDPVTETDVLESRVVADPLRLYECPAPCDGAAAIVITRGDVADDHDGTGDGVRVGGTGAHHPSSHLLGVRGRSLAAFPAIAGAAERALGDADLGVAELDVLEPYTPFPHTEAMLTEELGLFEHGEGAAACARGQTATDGAIPVSPSGGCIGRGHPPMVTPLLNYAAAVRQIRGESPVVDDVGTVLTTSEHGHIDGVTATVFGGDA
ncbi:thiolase family protein [Salinadaptatus halalkaliphilus]|uniref:Thiolase family protein n=1 Tax=Salinadaptatus halalkaliphilus TaxID=2419781 RepID=A0A4S3TPU4_9EURY|nr:thiolase family protein [Salinadaptatus halalkaliphilus]THE65243.1 thiolase family protein [Salinadaptatus halalkaliphilus]